MRKRVRKKLKTGEFSAGALVLRWTASPAIHHSEQAGVTRELLLKITDPTDDSLFPLGFGSENEWFLVLLPTRRTEAIDDDLADTCRHWLSRRRDVMKFDIQSFCRPSDAETAYRALLDDFDCRHPDS